MTMKRIGVYNCKLEMEVGGYQVWSRPLPSNYYVMEGETIIAYIGSGPKSHFFVSIFFPKGGGTHYSYTTEHSDLRATVDAIVEKLK